MIPSRGDVVLVSFPDSNLVTFKLRPALIIQDTSVSTGIAQVIIALITSNLARTGPTRVRINCQSSAGKTMGLLTDSVVVTDNVATVWESAIRRTIGQCPVMPKVDAALRLTLKL